MLVPCLPRPPVPPRDPPFPYPSWSLFPRDFRPYVWRPQIYALCIVPERAVVRDPQGVGRARVSQRGNLRRRRYRRSGGEREGRGEMRVRSLTLLFVRQAILILRRRLGAQSSKGCRFSSLSRPPIFRRQASSPHHRRRAVLLRPGLENEARGSLWPPEYRDVNGHTPDGV